MQECRAEGGAEPRPWGAAWMVGLMICKPDGAGPPCAAPQWLLRGDVNYIITVTHRMLASR